MRVLFRWLWPGGVILAADLALLRWVGTPAMLDGVAVVAGWAVLLGAALLAWRFWRSRTVALALFLGLLSVYAASTALPPAEALVPGMPDPWQLAGTLGMAGLALLALTRDRSVTSPVGATQVVLLLCLGGLGLTAYRWISLAELGPSPASISWLEPLTTRVLGMPLVFWATVLAAFTNTVFQGVRFATAAERGLAWSVVGLTLLAMAVPGSPEARVHVAATGLILLISSMETSWALAFRDDLTGLPSRRALDRFLRTAGRSYTLAMVRVDDFKRLTDRWGRDVGDQVLKLVASRMGRVSGGGTAFRSGSEAFAVVFPETSVDGTLEHLEELREAVAAASFRMRRFGRPRRKPAGARGGPEAKGFRTVSVTVSMGAAEASGRAGTAEEAVQAADGALNRAREAGGNRVAT